MPLWLASLLGAVLLGWHSSFQHETIHGHPTKSRRINALLGWPPLTLWLPYELYRETHLRHHRCKGRVLTNPGEDPESHYLPTGSLSDASRIARAILWFNRTLIGRLTIGPAISVARTWSAELAKIRVGAPGRLWIWLRHGASVSIVSAWVVLVCHIPPTLYVAALVYPSISLTLLRSFGEHGAHDDPQLRTNVVETNWALSLLFLNNNLHIVHHRAPGMAWYELPRAWRALRADAIETGLGVRPGYRDLIRKHFLCPIIAAEYPAVTAPA
jgi:fatty acid desaturase